MSRNWARFLAGIVAVAIVWIGAYWWLNPRADKISYGISPKNPVSTAPPPKPRPPVEIVDVKRTPMIAPSRGTTTPVVLPQQQAPTKSGTPAKPPDPVKPAVIPPRFEDYTVKSGDTLTSIATAKLGSTRHVDAIRRANPLKDLDKIKTGEVIRIPLDPSNIQGKPADGSPTPTAPSDRQGEMLEYTVRNGDTLSKISKDKYGSTAYQDLIYQANRDRLSSPNALREGQKLRIPKKPAA